MNNSILTTEMARWSSDVVGLLRGLQSVAYSIAIHQAETVKLIIDNSSIRKATEEYMKETVQQVSAIQLNETPVISTNKLRIILSR